MHQGHNQIYVANLRLRTITRILTLVNPHVVDTFLLGHWYLFWYFGQKVRKTRCVLKRLKCNYRLPKKPVLSVKNVHINRYTEKPICIHYSRTVIICIDKEDSFYVQYIPCTMHNTKITMHNIQNIHYTMHKNIHYTMHKNIICTMHKA